MKVEVNPAPAAETDADLLCLGLFDEQALPGWLAGAAGAGDVRSKFKELTMLRPDSPGRVLVIGLGERSAFDAERARVAAGLGVRQGRRYGAASLAWDVPGDERIAAALTDGTVLAAYRFDRLKTGADDDRPEGPGLLQLHGAKGADELVATARVAALAANRARDLQNLPANVADPAFLAGRAEEIAAHSAAVQVEILGPAELAELGMGGLIAVGAGSAKDPALIVLRYTGRRGSEPLAVVGKAVTFDSGGISLKPAKGMEEMKMDMSGGAAVLETTAAIAELGVDVDLIAAVPAVENMPSSTATRPGDIIAQLNGTTVEVNNTDAEGRLILADALTWCAREGAERMIDIATLTGAVVVALGSTHAALLGDDEELVATLEEAGRRSGELLWRLPLHPEYTELMKGTAADLTNAAPKRKAGTITAAAFLQHFTEGAGWAHVDIAGTAWDLGREYVGKGATGFGVRLLVDAVRSLAD